MIPAQIRRCLPPGTAAYLRYFPADAHTMLAHRSALRAHADALKVPRPSFYVDQGVSWRSMLPAYERLLANVRMGHYTAVLIPGPWVLALPDDLARARVEELAAHCRVLELSRRPR